MAAPNRINIREPDRATLWYNEGRGPLRAKAAPWYNEGGGTLRAGRQGYNEGPTTCPPERPTNSKHETNFGQISRPTLNHT